METTTQGRYYLLDMPVASPGACGICGYSGPDRSYLDPRLDFEFYGSLIFCSECMNSMANMMGYIEPAQALALERRVQEAESELVHLRAAALAVEEFKRAVGIRVDAGSNSVSVQHFDEHVASLEFEGEQELPFEADSDEGSDDNRSDEQTPEQGRDDVRRPDTSAEFGIDFL